MAFSPQLISAFAPRLDRSTIETFEQWLNETELEVDRSIVHSTGLVTVKGETRASHCWTRPSLGRALTEAECERVRSLYLSAGWGEVRVFNQLLCKEIHMVIIQLYPSTQDEHDGLEELVRELRKFAAGRTIRVLTRKANSQAGSGVAYARVVQDHVEAGYFELFLRVDGKDGVGAASVRTQAQLLKPRSQTADGVAWPDFEQPRIC